MYSFLGISFELLILKTLGKVLIFFSDSAIVHRQSVLGSENIFWVYVITSAILACPDVITWTCGLSECDAD